MHRRRRHERPHTLGVAPVLEAAEGVLERTASLKGSIMLSAMTGFAVAFVTGSVAIGFLAAAAVGTAIAAIVAFAGIELRLNQIAVGFVLTLLAS